MSPNNKLLDVVELAQYLGLQPKSIYNLRYRTPELLPPAILIGRRRLFWNRDNVDAFLDEQQEKTLERQKKTRRTIN
ncbi:helix-turn-helix transcriptional regulator [Kordiimonas lacus]|uniref:Helix-turn-helix domain-containing protein n=1 Tax=Kordiimonas lacus TaxID=637679 RepID=A0A1G7BJ12_9PROT|nr:hypothetical protein SAMN04488071_2542 [Kordiimonas lacus]